MATSFSREFEFSVKSLSPELATPELLDEVSEHLSELRLALADVEVQKITISKQKTLPIDPNTIIFTVSVLIGTEFTKEMAKKVADDVYEWLKNRWKRAEIKKTAANP